MSARKIAYNTIAQIGGKVVGFFISSFFLIILAGKLGTEGMGYYTTVTAFVGFFVNAADLGINTVMMREIAQNQAKKEEITGQFLGFRIVYGLLIMAMAIPIAWLFPQYRSLVAAGVGIAALAQFLLLINQTFVSVLQVSLQLDRAVFAEVVNRVVTLALVWYGATLVGDMRTFFYYVFWVTVVAGAINAAVSFAFARRAWTITPRFDTGRWRQILRLVIPMGIFSFLGMVHFKSDTVLLSLMRTPYEVGIYGYAYKIAEIMFSLPMMFIGIVFPQMSRLLKTDRSGFENITQKAFEVILVMTVPFIVGVYILAPYLTTLLSRQSVTDGLIAGSVLRILTVAMFAWFFGALYQHILLSGSSYKGLIRNLGIAVAINLALNVAFIPLYTYFAAAVTTVTTEMVMLILTLWHVKTDMRFTAKLKGWLAVVCGSLVMGLAVWYSLQLVAPDVHQFATAERPRQLIILMAAGAVGVFIYGLALTLWGKSSPLFAFAAMLKKPPNS